VGSDRDAIGRWLDDEVRKHERFFDTLKHMPRQFGLLFLRMCGVPKLNYFARTVRPSMLASAAAEFDLQVDRCFHSLIGRESAPLSPHSKLMSGLPLRMGGLGLRPYKRTSQAAWFAALSAAVRHFPFGERAEQLHKSLSGEIEKCIKDFDLGEWAEKKAFPQTSADFFTHFSETDVNVPHLQKIITSKIEDRLATNTKFTIEQQARIRSASDRNASQWLTTLPLVPELTMTDEEFAAAVCFRIGAVAKVANCACGQLIDDSHFDHAHHCRLVGKGAYNIRHDLVLKALQRMANRTGAYVEVEYSSKRPHHQPRQRPDALFSGLRLNLLTDVAIATPTAPSHAKRSAGTTLAAAKKIEKAKITKYSAYATREECELVPFVLESYGAWGTEAERVIGKLSDMVRRFSDIDDGGDQMVQQRFMNDCRRNISVALQRGNAWCTWKAEHRGRRSHNVWAARRAARDAGIHVAADEAIDPESDD
jgi:hypothetical protein